jgi:hypothetical protein
MILRAIIVILTVLFFGHHAICQIHVTSPVCRKLYRGLENPLVIMEEKSSAGSLIVTVDTGNLKSVGKGDYIFTSGYLGSVTFTVKSKRTKMEAKFKYEIVEFPLPIARIGNIQKSVISKKELQTQKQITANISDDFGIICGVSISILSFSFIIMHGDSITHLENIKGPAFTENCKKSWISLEAGDRIVFFNIMARYYGNTGRLDPIEYTISE